MLLNALQHRKKKIPIAGNYLPVPVLYIFLFTRLNKLYRYRTVYLPFQSSFLLSLHLSYKLGLDYIKAKNMLMQTEKENFRKLCVFIQIISSSRIY